ncbi:MAG: hypothetical protein V3T84_00630 [Phycisphaerales bacterium]
MKWPAATLWDLLGLTKRKRPSAPGNPQPPARPPMRRRYDALVVEMKQTYGIRVRKWRSSSTGCAWIVRYNDGDERRLIEAPYPKGPTSCAIFLHEVGHHAIGFGTYRPRCLEEYHAWQWALQTMRAKGLNVTAAVEKRMAESLRYAVQKAQRRGLKSLPPQLGAYV